MESFRIFLEMFGGLAAVVAEQTVILRAGSDAMVLVRHIGNGPSRCPAFALQYHNLSEGDRPQAELKLEVTHSGITAFALRNEYTGETLKLFDLDKDGEPCVFYFGAKQRLREVVREWDETLMEMEIEGFEYAEALP
jgi:hypothetical protein